MNRQMNRGSQTLTLLVSVLALLVQAIGEAQPVPISELGRYEGYSQPVYSQWTRQSQYVTVRDGTRLAVDIFRPEDGGGLHRQPLPVIWTHDRYQRAFFVFPSGRIISQLWDHPWLETLLRHGFVVGVVDVRGSGASYGSRSGEFSAEEAEDAYDITEWFAAQSWCTGKIGMYGRSYLGISQYFAAGTAPPHLVAIFPEMALLDGYAFNYPGGVFRDAFVSSWSDSVHRQDTNPVNPNVPVDEDLDGALLAEAMAEHWANANIPALVASAPYRDSVAENGAMIHMDPSPSTLLERVRQSGVAVYHLSGWYGAWPRDALLWYRNLETSNPQKIVIGPWSHGQHDGLDWAAEHLRWYDYSLKDLDNGVMDEAPIHYYTMGAPAGQGWRSAWRWPLPQEQSTRYYFQAGPSGSVASSNDGLLGLEAPTNPEGRDDFIVDYTTTTGRATRWTNTHGGDFDYPDMTTNDEKGLTFTTPPLASDVELTGHPVVHLWVTSTAADGDFIVLLEEAEVSGSGRTRGGGQRYASSYVTEGTLRASHRSISTPPYDHLGLPYHRSYAEDIAELPPGEPVELIIDLHPTSRIFRAGNRIRVTITCADRDSTQTPELSPAPTVSVYRNSEFSSYVILPVIPTPTEDP